MEDPVTDEVPFLDFVYLEGHLILVEIVAVSAFRTGVGPPAQPLLGLVNGPSRKVVKRLISQPAPVIEPSCEKLHAKDCEDNNAEDHEYYEVSHPWQGDKERCHESLHAGDCIDTS